MSQRTPSPLVLWLLFLALSFIWGSSYLFIKIGLDEGLPPVTLVAYRLLIATAFLAVVLRVTSGRLPTERSAVAKLALLALVNIVVPFTLITWGELWIPSALASILNGLVPLFTIVLAAAVLRDEPITVNRLAGLLVGFAGALVLISPRVGAESPGADGLLVLLGEIALVAAAVSYAVSGVFVRSQIAGKPLIADAGGARRSPTPAEIGLSQNIVAGIVTLAIALTVERPDGGLLAVPPTAAAWFAVIWLGVLGSGVAYLLFFPIITAWGATRTSMVTYVMPVVGIALGFLVLGERLHPLELAGSALIIGGLVLTNSRVGARRLVGRGEAEAPARPVAPEPAPD